MEMVTHSVSRIPLELQSNPQFDALSALYNVKSVFIRKHILDAFMKCFSFRMGGLSVCPSDTEITDLWQAASRVNITDQILVNVARSSIDSVLLNLVRSKVGHTLQATDTEWSLIESRHDTCSLQANCGYIISFSAFMGRWIGESLIADFGRRVWTALVPAITKYWGQCEEATQLEAALIDMGFLPAQTNRIIFEKWQAAVALKYKVSAAAVLAKVRDNLSADVNRVPYHVNLRGKDSALKGTYVPTAVSKEVVHIASDFFQSKENADVVPKIISLFILLRKPEMSDPDAVNPRHAALFFNDCTYLSLALAVSGLGLAQEIGLLRSTASKSITWFLNTVKVRSASHLRTSGGLLENQQIADAEDSIYRCFSEINLCVRDWTGLRIPTDISNAWKAILVEAIMKRMTVLSVETARDALGRSTKTGGILSGSTTYIVNSGLWTVHKTFMDEVKSLNLPQDDTSHRIAWVVTDRIRLALTGSEVDIMRAEPLPDDEMLYGISAKGFEAVLHCNPILRGDAKSCTKLASRLMIQELSAMDVDGPGSISSNERKNFAALFE